MLTFIANVLKILNSEAEPGQVSLALCFSMVMGFSPLFSVYSLLVFFLVLFIRVNLSAFFLGWGAFTLLGYAFDPLFHILGLSILETTSLEGLFTVMYNIPLFRVLAFNNSLVMGSLVCSLVLFVPLFLLFKVLITRYRVDFLSWIEKIKLVQILKSSKLFDIYNSLSS